MFNLKYYNSTIYLDNTPFMIYSKEIILILLNLINKNSKLNINKIINNIIKKEIPIIIKNLNYSNEFKYNLNIFFNYISKLGFGKIELKILNRYLKKDNIKLKLIIKLISLDKLNSTKNSFSNLNRNNEENINNNVNDIYNNENNGNYNFNNLNFIIESYLINYLRFYSKELKYSSKIINNFEKIIEIDLIIKNKNKKSDLSKNSGCGFGVNNLNEINKFNKCIILNYPFIKYFNYNIENGELKLWNARAILISHFFLINLFKILIKNNLENIIFKISKIQALIYLEMKIKKFGINDKKELINGMKINSKLLGYGDLKIKFKEHEIISNLNPSLLNNNLNINLNKIEIKIFEEYFSIMLKEILDKIFNEKLKHRRVEDFKIITSINLNKYSNNNNLINQIFFLKENENNYFQIINISNRVN